MSEKNPYVKCLVNINVCDKVADDNIVSNRKYRHYASDSTEIFIHHLFDTYVDIYCNL